MAAARLWNQPPLAESALPKKYGPKFRLAIRRSASPGPCRGRSTTSASASAVNLERPRQRRGGQARLGEDDDRVVAPGQPPAEPAVDLAGERRCALVRDARGVLVDPEQHPVDLVPGLRLGANLGAVVRRSARLRAEARHDEAGQLDPPSSPLAPQGERVRRRLYVALVRLEAAGDRADGPLVVERAREQDASLPEVPERVDEVGRRPAREAALA